MNATLPNPLALTYRRPPHPDNLYKDCGEINYWYERANQSDPRVKLMRQSFERDATEHLEGFIQRVANHRASDKPDADLGPMAVAFCEQIVAMHWEAIRNR